MKLARFIGLLPDFYNDHSTKTVSTVAAGATAVPPGTPAAKPVVAVISVVGEIVQSREEDGLPFDYDEHYVDSSSLVPLLRKLQEDGDVKAVVLRIDSPGESVLKLIPCHTPVLLAGACTFAWAPLQPCL